MRFEVLIISRSNGARICQISVPVGYAESDWRAERPSGHGLTVITCEPDVACGVGSDWNAENSGPLDRCCNVHIVDFRVNETRLLGDDIPLPGVEVCA